MTMPIKCFRFIPLWIALFSSGSLLCQPASAGTLVSGGLTIDVDGDGEFNDVFVNGTSVDDSSFVQRLYFNGNDFSLSSVVSIVGNTASYTNTLGGFNFTITGQALGNLGSLGAGSEVYEETITFTNLSGMDAPLAIVSGIDQDLDGSGGSAAGDVVAFDPVTSAVFAVDDPIFFAAIGQAQGLFGWEVEDSAAEPSTFPLANNLGPLGPGDTSVGLGFDFGVIPNGASGVAKFRYLFDINGTSSVPGDFTFGAPPVPEPGSFAIFATGAITLLGCGTRRRKR